MLIKNKPSSSKKLAYIAAFSIGLSITAAQAADRDDDLGERAAKFFGSYASKSSKVQEAIELFEPLLPKQVVTVRRYIPPATTWGRFKQKCAEILEDLTQCFSCTNGDNND